MSSQQYLGSCERDCIFNINIFDFRLN